MNKNNVYECKICKAHYLTFEGVSEHLQSRHKVNFRSTFALSELGHTVIDVVPRGAAEFD